MSDRQLVVQTTHQDSYGQLCRFLLQSTYIGTSSCRVQLQSTCTGYGRATCTDLVWLQEIPKSEQSPIDLYIAILFSKPTILPQLSNSTLFLNPLFDTANLILTISKIQSSRVSLYSTRTLKINFQRWKYLTITKLCRNWAGKPATSNRRLDIDKLLPQHWLQRTKAK